MIPICKGKLLAFFFAALIIVGEGSVYAFDYYQPDETGSKASAMGRAFVAVADDPRPTKSPFIKPPKPILIP